MRSVVNIAAGLVAALLLVLAGWLATLPLAAPGGNDGMWLCAGVLVLLALAVQPPVGRRYPWLIAGLALLVALFGFEAANYKAWHAGRAALIHAGLSSSVGAISVDATVYGGVVMVPGTTTLAPALRRLSPQETKGVLIGKIAGDDAGAVYFNIDWFDDGEMGKGFYFTVPAVAVRRGILPIAKDASDFAAAGAARDYLKAGTTTISGQGLHLTLPNCPGLMTLEADPPLDNGDVAVSITAQPFVVSLSPDCMAGSAQMPAKAFIQTLQAETAVTMTVTDSRGRTILTAVVPMARLTEALQERRRLWERIRSSDVGPPFSPFSYYLTAKPAGR